MAQAMTTTAPVNVEYIFKNNQDKKIAIASLWISWVLSSVTFLRESWFEETLATFLLKFLAK